MNKILCFDVSNNSCSVAVALGEQILSFEQDLRPSVQAEKLLIMIESALSKANLNYSDLDYLAVTVGPGSFTGIRIGLATAKGIIYASNIQGVAITNFEIAFYRLKMQIKNFDSAIIMLNAYRNQLYIQKFCASGNIINAPTLIDCNDVSNYLKQQQGKIVCTGSGLKEVYGQIKNMDGLTLLPRFPTIRAIHIARYADQKIRAGQFGTIEPMYIRPPDATSPK